MKYIKKHHISGPCCTDEIEYGLGSFYPMPGGLKAAVALIQENAKKLIETIADVNSRTDGLAAVTEEIAASNDTILNTSSEVKKSLHNLLDN